MQEDGYYWAIFNDSEDGLPTLIMIENGRVYQFGTDITFPVDDVEIVEEVQEYCTDW